jgi:hypothetical protein
MIWQLWLKYTVTSKTEKLSPIVKNSKLKEIECYEKSPLELNIILMTP